MTGAISPSHMEKLDFSREHRLLLSDSKIESLSLSQIHTCRPVGDMGDVWGI